MAKVSNEKKLEAVKEWLSENGIPFIENYRSGFGVTMDLKLPSLMIAVFLSDGDRSKEEKIFFAGTHRWKMRYSYKPFFIRESETKAFVLEKMQNCCFNRMVELQKRFEKESKKKNETEEGNQ